MTIAVIVFLIVAVGLYLKAQSSYDLVRNEIGKQSEKNKDRDIGNSKEESSTKPIEDFERSAEDIALDKRIKETRLRNEELYKKMGGITSVDGGGDVNVDSPKRTRGRNCSNTFCIKGLY